MLVIGLIMSYHKIQSLIKLLHINSIFAFDHVVFRIINYKKKLIRNKTHIFLVLQKKKKFYFNLISNAYI